MRDPVLKEALTRLAAEAAGHLRSLVHSGEDVPFDVAEDDGEHTFFRYVPLSARFVRDHALELHALPSFGPACGAVAMAAVAVPYLEERGEIVSEDPDERSAKMLVEFLAELWQESAEFTVERSRLDRALEAIDAHARDISEAGFLVCPLIGLQMPVPSLELPSVRIARADSIQVPPEAMRSEGMQRSAWEPQFVAVVDQPVEGREAIVVGVRILRELVTVLRLFREGGVGLGPYAFAPTGEGYWRRIATGAPAPRPCAYKLADSETEDLAEFARAAEAAPDATGPLAWAIARFELGLERPTATDALSDHLLALRALLEGEGPIGGSVPMRVAALCADADERDAAAARVQAAFDLEARVMAGISSRRATAEGAESAVQVTSWVEGALRSVLREAVRGSLPNEPLEEADEVLVTSAVSKGEGSGDRGSTAEWEAVPVFVDVGGEPDTELLEVDQPGEIRVYAAGSDEDEEPIVLDEADQPSYHDEPSDEDYDEYDDDDQHSEEHSVFGTNVDWLSEIEREDRATLEWPSVEGRGDRERVETPRVRHLFPVPDDTDWDVSELEYSRDKARVNW